MANPSAETGGLAEHVQEVLAVHESLLGSDDYRACVCGAVTGDLGGLRSHVAEAVAESLTSDGWRHKPWLSDKHLIPPDVAEQ